MWLISTSQKRKGGSTRINILFNKHILILLEQYILLEEEL